MATIKPFKGLRPLARIVEELACLPYDVMNSEEAAQMAEGKAKSLLRITKAEIECPDVDDIVANQDDANQAVWLCQQLKYALCRAVACFCLLLGASPAAVAVDLCRVCNHKY